jgi:HEAT repeat protein
MKYSAKVDKLLNYAVFDFSKDWSDYLALGFTEEDVPALLQLAQDKEALQDEDDLASSAPFHAWRVLGLLKAEASVLPLFAAIGNDDWSTEEIPTILGLIGEKAIAPIKQYLSDPETDENKDILMTAFGKIIANNPEYREQGVAFFTEYLANITDKNFYLAGFVVYELIDLNAKESIETIRAAFQRGCVDISIAGDIEDVEIEMGLRQHRDTPKPDYHGKKFDEIRQALAAFSAKTKVEPPKKIGRNDPCPCGSGKKYKKCCLH